MQPHWPLAFQSWTRALCPEGGTWALDGPPGLADPGPQTLEMDSVAAKSERVEYTKAHGSLQWTFTLKMVVTIGSGVNLTAGISRTCYCHYQAKWICLRQLLHFLEFPFPSKSTGTCWEWVRCCNNVKALQIIIISTDYSSYRLATLGSRVIAGTGWRYHWHVGQKQ